MVTERKRERQPTRWRDFCRVENRRWQLLGEVFAREVPSFTFCWFCQRYLNPMHRSVVPSFHPFEHVYKISVLCFGLIIGPQFPPPRIIFVVIPSVRNLRPILSAIAYISRHMRYAS